jgi:hypothetical protein
MGGGAWMQSLLHYPSQPVIANRAIIRGPIFSEAAKPSRQFVTRNRRSLTFAS